jgi:oligopeptide/dipeptide ABC transporter ATP-binding protein
VRAATGLTLLDVSDLAVEFSRGRLQPPLRAVDDVSFSIAPRETVGLVGESGSGKTTIGRAILGLAPISAGAVIFSEEDITHASSARRRALSAELQVVFQDPYSSLNPTRTVGQTLGETLRVHRRDLSRAELADRSASMLEQVGLPPDAARRYPVHFSGGQRQRIAIARALMAQPRLVICDEPTSALDLSVQAQVLNLLRELQDQFELSYLFISHDLAVVRHLSHRIIVLYQGRMMEQGPAATVYNAPLHPYTKALLAAAPVPDPEEQRRRRARRARSVPAMASLPAPDSCPFAPRCPHAVEICRSKRPPLEDAPAGSLVACHRWAELSTNQSSVQELRVAGSSAVAAER